MDSSRYSIDSLAPGTGDFLYLGRVHSHSSSCGHRRSFDPSHSGPQTGIVEAFESSVGERHHDPFEG